MKHRLVAILSIVVILSSLIAACNGEQPSTNMDSTVEAQVIATMVEATIHAKVKATVNAMRGVDNLLTPVDTVEPTTIVTTKTVNPLPVNSTTTPVSTSSTVLLPGTVEVTLKNGNKYQGTIGKIGYGGDWGDYPLMKTGGLYVEYDYVKNVNIGQPDIQNLVPITVTLRNSKTFVSIWDGTTQVQILNSTDSKEYYYRIQNIKFIEFLHPLEDISFPNSPPPNYSDDAAPAIITDTTGAIIEVSDLRVNYHYYMRGCLGYDFCIQDRSIRALRFESGNIYFGKINSIEFIGSGKVIVKLTDGSTINDDFITGDDFVGEAALGIFRVTILTKNVMKIVFKR